MPLVKYVGPHAAVDVLMPNETWKRVRRGATLDTTAEHAEALLMQEDNWKAEAPAKRQADDAASEGGE